MYKPAYNEQHGRIQRGGGAEDPESLGKSQVAIGFLKKFWYGLPREAFDPLVRSIQQYLHFHCESTFEMPFI